MAISIVLARGGSKGIKNKNMANIAGRPLIYWTIDLALRCKNIESIYVSSDCSKILDFSMSIGAKCIRRPDELSGDNVSSEAGWLHALSVIEKEIQLPTEFISFQATSPIRFISDVDDAFDAFYNSESDSLFSAEKVLDKYIWKKEELRFLPDNFKMSERAMRQNLEAKFLENGSFYIMNTQKFLKLKKRHLQYPIAFEMPKSRSFQIDSIDDVFIVDSVMSNMLNKKGNL